MTMIRLTTALLLAAAAPAHADQLNSDSARSALRYVEDVNRSMIIDVMVATALGLAPEADGRRRGERPMEASQ
jgi:hypothetical protein